jgi:hypothetical protein
MDTPVAFFISSISSAVELPVELSVTSLPVISPRPTFAHHTETNGFQCTYSRPGRECSDRSYNVALTDHDREKARRPGCGLTSAYTGSHLLSLLGGREYSRFCCCEPVVQSCVRHTGRKPELLERGREQLDAVFQLSYSITDGALATEYFANGHPSLPNYLSLTSGSNNGISIDECYQSVVCPAWCAIWF